MKIRNFTSTMSALATALVFTICAAEADADLLSYMPFDGGAIGQSLADTTASGPGAIGFTSSFTGITSAGNSRYDAGLAGSLGGSGNAFQAGFGGSHRNRMIIDRTTAAWQGAGASLLENPADPNTLIGNDGSTLYGSVLISNPFGAPAGFTGLEFAAGNPNSNRVITLGEANSGDWVVIGNGQAGNSATSTNLALPSASAATREIVFRIDYGVGNADTFTLINPDGSDGAMSSTSNMTFSTLHLASFSGAPAVTYDEIRLGTTLADVTSAVPEPSSLTLFGLVASLAGLRRKR